MWVLHLNQMDVSKLQCVNKTKMQDNMHSYHLSTPLHRDKSPASCQFTSLICENKNNTSLLNKLHTSSSRSTATESWENLALQETIFVCTKVHANHRLYLSKSSICDASRVVPFSVCCAVTFNLLYREWIVGKIANDTPSKEERDI